MYQCLNCSKSCVETTIFCDECRASLLKRRQAPGAEQIGQDARPVRVFKRCIVPKAGGSKLSTELANAGLPTDFKIATASSLSVALEIALHA